MLFYKSKNVGQSFPMLTSLKINNFKAIQELSLDDLGLINVIIGKNGTGKTAFLEAIWLAAGGSPELILRERAWRGQNNQFSGDINAGFSKALRGIFGEYSDQLSVDIRYDDGCSRSVKVQSTETSVSFSEGHTTSSLGLDFTWVIDGKEHTTHPKLDSKGTLHLGQVPTKEFAHFFAARIAISESEIASHYSKLRIANNHKIFENALTEEFPQLSDLSVESPSGAAAIYSKLEGKSQRYSLADISGGISHLAGILVTLASNPRIIGLIDEIENGLYYDTYQSIWRTLHKFSKANQNQLFITTHNKECIEALSIALEGNWEDIKFFRSSINSDNGSMILQPFEAETIFDAMKLGEVR